MRLVSALLCIAWLVPAVGEPALRLIELKVRDAQDLIRMLRPLAGPEVAIGGSDRHLILRAAPERLDELSRIVSELDRPARPLVISVFQGRMAETQPLGSGPEAKTGEAATAPALESGETRVHRTAGRLDATQRIRVGEGEPAFIAAGSRRPHSDYVFSFAPAGLYPWGRSEVRHNARGFLVRAHVIGDSVSVELEPFLEHVRVEEAASELQRARSRVSGRLGEWIAVAQTEVGEVPEAKGALRRHSTPGPGELQVWLRVDLAD
jgi:hypothetical protein